ncbi:hypothetical protein ACIA8F_27835 [Streptomyces sp. NPDC051563]|uniref:hypothetical protein n=1 Tax=Streptomyces sp. NPDC051563 TaxID=3365659 RepID=UPI00378D1EA0
MRPTRTAVLLTAGLVTALGIPAVSAAAAPADLFVNNGADSHCSDTRPGASSLNTLAGITVPNHVMTPVGPGGKVSIFNSHGGPNHVITDLLGYFTQP